ncbi:hypothetical protein K474DRAFT_1666654 [Panus rudis PR-1116 ss-1]|nr:hypothetical protein K474DRAFT_1666654 [Panus rudis PR-1116 ss-1]
MGLSGLTPVGLAFVIIVLLLMVTGLSAVAWYSWIAPWHLRRLKRKAIEQAQAARNLSLNNPDNDNDSSDVDIEKAAMDLSLSPDQRNLNDHDDNQASEEKTSNPNALPPTLAVLSRQEFGRENDLADVSEPEAAYRFERKVRFSTSTQDGLWWFH